MSYGPSLLKKGGQHGQRVYFSLDCFYFPNYTSVIFPQRSTMTTSGSHGEGITSYDDDGGSG
jgi:hypothetical protein